MKTEDLILLTACLGGILICFIICLTFLESIDSNLEKLVSKPKKKCKTCKQEIED